MKKLLVAVALLAAVVPAATTASATATRASATATRAATAKTAKPGAKVVPAPREGLIVSRCRFSRALPDDPIMKPGLPGQSHLHEFFGNTSTDASSTAASLLAASTTCRVAGDRAAYWAPALYADGTRVQPRAMSAYYSSRGGVTPTAFPTGLEMVAGGTGAPGVVRWACFSGGMPRSFKTVPPACGDTESLAVGIRFPDCWDGVRLHSPDERSHMAYGVNGACPSTHPVAVPRLVVWVMYPRQPKGTTFTLASGPITTAHADFFNAWAPNDFARLRQYCLVEKRVCYKNMYKILTRLGLAKNP